MHTARILLTLAFASLALGCKQPEGGRCQTADDCEPPLVCSASEPRTCRPTGSELTSDAAPAADSRFDAHLFDANTSPPDSSVEPSDAGETPMPDAGTTSADAS